MLGLEHDGRVLGDSGALEVEDLVHVLADHFRDQLELGDLVDVVDAHEVAVAQNGQAVGHFKDLIEEVGDEDDADALFLQRAHDREKLLDLVFVERRGRLVEDEHLGVDVHRAGDGNHLLNGGGIVGERPGDVDVHVEALHQFVGAAVDLLPVDLMMLHRLAADEYIFSHGEVRAEVDLLKHRGDAHFDGSLRRSGTDGLALEEDLARVHLIDAGQALDQRRLTGAVLAQQGVHFAGAEREVHLVQRLDAGELDLDPPHFQQFRQMDPSLQTGFGGRFSSGAAAPGSPAMADRSAVCLSRRARR